ncbi:tyrosine-type recombinase/integrase [Paenibacillus glycinis]|uniref:Tyrosine-type recombinase/integrase n=1 Tax=Paenibacillus glycinis TaxID=2697035 RepID=A0ABW9Y0K7_9BACL|nr:site-specific integrase [Paenibacillus glycinis]NBD28001.1 tyrosine-type recombinase/integrase [Paenibacillus glycinis]
MENQPDTNETFDLSTIMDEFAKQLKQPAENQEEKVFPWNTPSTQIKSVECLTSQESDQNVTNIRFKVVDLLDSLFAIDFHKEQPSPYLGPNGINEWILRNLLCQLKNTSIINWLNNHSKMHPFELHQRYLIIREFIAYLTKQLQITSEIIDSQVLSNKEVYLAFARHVKLSQSNAKILQSLFNHFQPFLELTLPVHKRAATPPFNHPLVEKHLLALKMNGGAQQSYHNSKACREFLTWLCQCYVEFNDFNPNSIPLHLVKQPHLLEYRLYLKRRISIELKDDKSVSTDFYYVRSLFQSLHRMGLIKDDVAFDVKGLPFENYHYRELPNNEELLRFFDIVRTYSPNPSVHLLIYSLLLHLGLRIAEAVNLSWESFNFSTWSLSIKGKDGNYSIMPLPKQIISLCQSYTLGTNGPIVDKAPKSYISELTRFHRLYCLMAGWNYERGGFHLFRHAYITRLSEHPQCTPKLLMKLARHVKPASTSIYIHRSRKSLQQAIERIKYNLT